MAGKTHLDFKMLDAGFGARPKGDVNILDPQIEEHNQRELMTRLKAENPVLADVTYLPFRDESFTLAFSDHAIVHVQNPFSPRTLSRSFLKFLELNPAAFARKF